MQGILFNRFEQAASEQELKELQQEIKQQGYANFRQLLEDFDQRIRSFDDQQVDSMYQLLEKARKTFPTPQQFSPSWQHIWDVYEQRIRYKHKLLSTIPPAEREAQWQIIMDNPYTNQEVVCYPDLSFMEAAYLYCYFRPELVSNEYIQVQKVNSVFMEYGDS